MTDQQQQHPSHQLAGNPRGELSPSGLVLRLTLVAIGLAVVGTRFGILPTVLVVVALIVIVFLHELGHYLTAKRSGMKVTEFFLGFGPRIWSFERGETTYGVKAIPAGAYVRIIGMTNLEEVDPEDEHRTYRAQSYPKRMLVVCAGSAVHFLLALVMLYGLLVGVGTFADEPTTTVSQVVELDDGAPSPAQQAGLAEGDRIVAVDGQPIQEWQELTAYLVPRPGERVVLTVERAGSTLEVPVELASVDDPEAQGGERGFLGVAPHLPRERVGVVEAVPETFSTFWTIGWESSKALVGFFAPGNLFDYADRVSSGPAGTVDPADEENRFLSPVGFVRVASQAAETGIPAVVWLLVLINIFVGIFNMVPLLPFDGGHAAVATYERIRSRAGQRYHADIAKLLPLTYGVVLVLVLLGLSALWLDLSSPLESPFAP